MTSIEKGSSFGESENPEIKSLLKHLKVVNKPSGDFYSPGINIQGKYLNKFGFEVGDKVAVDISLNRILIEKILQDN